MAKLGKAKLHNYDYRFGESDGSAAAIIVSMVQDNSRVLEIGAGPGSISRVLKEKNGCNLTAIEFDPNSVENLKTFCDAVYHLDLNDEDWASTFDGIDTFDTIVAADVLEHLLDPLATLKLAKTLLSPQGQIIVSLPHVGHAAVMACLFNSDFPYQRDGLLDRTHLRFFGIKNIQKLFGDAELHIEDVGFVVRSPDATELMTQWKSVKPDVRKLLLTSEFSEIYQVIVKASLNTKSGKNIDITTLIAPKPRFSLAQFIIPSANVRMAARRFLKTKFGPETRHKIRRFARTLRLDF